MARVKAGAINGTARVRFVEISTAPLIRMDVDDGREVAGAFVKLSPRLTRAERLSFDAGAARRMLLERGAAVAVVAPVTLPDDSPKEVAPRRIDARAEVREWFAVASASVDESAAALDGCLQILDEVRL